ncbi:DUF2784 domain-containing protein [Vreelandella aquamarina]
MSQQMLLMLADGVLIFHILYVAFVVFGLLAVYAGYFFQWQWVRHRVWRVAHLLAIGYVVVQSWLGIVCPLTTWEMALREKAGEAVYSGSFIQHWLQNLLFFDAPNWVFVLVYSVFGSLVLASWFVVRPHKRPLR